MSISPRPYFDLPQPPRPVLAPPSSRQPLRPSDMQSEPSLRITSKSSSEYDDSDSNNDFIVLNKITKLLETDNPSPIIEKIKSISYIQKILKSMEHHLLFLSDDKKERKKKVSIELKYRISKIKKGEKQEELKELKTKLKRLQTKLEKLRANKPHYIPELMENKSKITREKLENAEKILANPLGVSVRVLQFAIRDIKSYIIEQESIINELKEQVCSRILTPKQVGQICWFMATFVAMFYSQRSRKVLLKASKRWKQDKLFTSLKNVLDEKYLMSKNEKEDYEKFSDDTFGNILRLLFEKDAKSFPYNPELIGGFSPEIYIGKLYNLLGIDYRMFDYANSSKLAYSYYNMEYDLFKYEYENGEYIRRLIDIKKQMYIYKKDTSTPTILIIRVFDGGILSQNMIQDETIKKELTSMRDEIKYNGKTYILDSVILSDNNIKHAITGITCKGIKYIYNGWTKTTIDRSMASEVITRDFPCGLQRHDWDVEGQGDDFCLNTTTCRPDILSKDKLANELRICFNFSEGERLLIYVLKDKHLEQLNKAATTLRRYDAS